MVENLSKNILATICYYDVMDYPLTSFEIWKHLIGISNFEFTGSASWGREENISNESPGTDPLARGSASLSEKSNFLHDVVAELESDKLKRFLEKYRGFYFLKGRQELVERRVNNDKISAGKIKKLRRIVWLFHFVPYVRMIGVTGRLAMKNAGEESDWDLLVVIKSGKIWTGRTLVTLVAHLLGKRRHGNKIRDRICLNYYVTDESLEIITKDMFSAHEYSFMFPLLGGEIYKKFQLKNRWIKNFRPNYGLSEIGNLKLLDKARFSETIRGLGEIILNWPALENWLENWQKAKIMRNPKTRKRGSLIQATRDALVFLPEPQGPKIFEKFRKRIESLA